jgi:hypothetical protein
MPPVSDRGEGGAKSISCSTKQFQSGKLFREGSRAVAANQTLVVRRRKSAKTSGAAHTDPDVGSTEGTSNTLLGGARVIDSGWREQRHGRRKNRRVGPVIIERKGYGPLILSSEQAEACKITIWADYVPSVKVVHMKLTKVLPAEDYGKILRVRNLGMNTSRRIELLFDTRETRDRLLEKLNESPLGFKGERARVGRTWEERNATQRTRSKGDEMAGEHVTQPERTQNRFAPLSLKEGEDVGLSIGVFNANGLSEMFIPLWRQAKLSPALLAVTETYRCAGEKPFYLPGYRFLEPSMRPGTRRRVRVNEDSHGVGFFVRNDWARAVKPLEEPAKFADCLWVRTPRNFAFNKGIGNTHQLVEVKTELWIGVYYFAPLLSEEALMRGVHEMISIIQRAGASGAECILVGDLNCCLRSLDDPFRPQRDGNEMIRRAKVLTEVLEEHGLFSLHELKPDCSLFTVMRGGAGRTMRDYIIVPRSSSDLWRAPYVHCDSDLGSDHWLLTSRRSEVLRVISETATLPTIGEDQQVTSKKYHSGWKIGSLCPQSSAEHDPKSAEKADKLRAAIREGLIAKRVAESLDAPDFYEQWAKAVDGVLDEVLGRRKAVKKRKPPSYFTDEVWVALTQRRVAYTALRRAVNALASEEVIRDNWQSYLESKKHADAVLAEARKARWLTFMNEIESAPRGSRKFWQLLHRSKGEADLSRWDSVRDKAGNLINPDSPAYLKRWAEYNAELGTAKPSDATSPMWDTVNSAVNSDQFLSDHDPRDETLSWLNRPIELSEVEAALDGLPNHKAVGADGYSNEVLKAIGPEALHGLLLRVWEEEVCPEPWILAIIHPLKKPGDPTLLSNSRGISLMSCVAKLYESVLQVRLARALDESGRLHDEQCGFRAERECSDHILVLTEALRIRKASGLSTFAVFIDFAKAFDTVWRNAMLYKLSGLGVRGKLLRVIRALYAHTDASVRVNGRFTDSFEVQLGVRQGGVLSPILFLAFINDLIGELKRQKIGVKIAGWDGSSAGFKTLSLAGLLWADDVAILADSPEMLRRALAVVDTWCDNWLMRVNASKCNVMVFGSKPERSHDALVELANRTPFTLGGMPVLPSKTYKYLGVLLSYDLTWDAAVSARAEVVRRAIFSQSKILQNRNLSCELRFRFFEAVIMPVALWGSEFWGGQKNLCGKLETVLATGLRMVSGAPPRASREAIWWELGYAPLFLRAATRRLRLFNKLRSIDLRKTPSGRWARQAVMAKVTKQWGWVRRTIHLANHELKAAVSSNTLAGNGYSDSTDYKSLLSSASLLWFRRWAKRNGSTGTLLLGLHASDKYLATADYLKHRGVITRIMLMCRTNSLMLNYRVSSFSAVRSKTCMTCATTAGAVVEDLEHFLVKCPGLELEREKLWFGFLSNINQRVPDSVLAALGESAEFFDNLEPATKRELQRARLLSLGGMWRVRSARLAEHSNNPNPNPTNLTPRVEAN